MLARGGGGGGGPFGSVFTDAGDAARWLESRGPGCGVMLAVKPQVFGGVGGVAETWGERLGGRLVVSMLAGTTVATIAAGLPGTRVVRVMPNTPIRLGLGMTAVTGGGRGRGEWGTCHRG
jgi:pyrroline-5-carboxylate reductase